MLNPPFSDGKGLGPAQVGRPASASSDAHGPKMAESSDARDVSIRIEDLEYMHASNVNVSDFVSVKFSRRNFCIWKDQMVCLMKSQKMDGMVENDYKWRQGKSVKIVEKYEHLLKGWILGSVSEEKLYKKDLYDRSPMKIWRELEEWKKSGDLLSPDQGNSVDIRNGDEALEDDSKLKKKLFDITIEGSWWRAKSILEYHKQAATEEISTHRNTMLHIAVRKGNNYFVEKMLNFIKDGKLIERVNCYGYTPLHIAAECGNTDAAKLLVEKRKELLDIGDYRGTVPLIIAFRRMHDDTFLYLLEFTKNWDAYLSFESTDHADLLTRAIWAKKFDFANTLLNKFPTDNAHATDDEVIMALIRNIPSELGFGEALIYPSLKNAYGNIVNRSFLVLNSLEYSYTRAESTLRSMRRSRKYYFRWLLPEIIIILLVPIAVLYVIYELTVLLIFVLLFPLFMLYFLLWKAFSFVVPAIKRVENRKKVYKEARDVMEKIYSRAQYLSDDHMFEACLDAHHMFEAACLDAHHVLRQFIFQKPGQLACLGSEAYNIMKLAVTNRSCKVYELFRDFMHDVRNNLPLDINLELLPLAGKLPPVAVLSSKTGAALQLQRELQWFQEVSRHAEHRLLTQRNDDNETPEMVFTREHADLVKEGENWMKTTAESCSITAALIVTIVFAAAITVPGGNNQEKGIPLFRKEIAFTIFAVSDAISLFTGATSLSVFLSILTTRFAEKDFLVVLPRRLLIGLFLLLLSTTAMMVAFSTILFLVFCDQRQWMLAPICALACVPIAAVVFLQFPLMFDLFHSTYFPIFGKEHRKRSYSKEE